VDKLIERYADTAPRERYGAIAIIVLLVVGGFWFFFWSDQSSELESLEDHYRSVENERAEKQAYVDNLAKYEARLNDLQESLNQAREQLPDDPDVPQLLAQLDNRARQAGLQIDRFEPRGETVKDFVAEIGFDVKVRGSYHEIASFIDSVGKLDRIVNVMGIQMEQPQTVNQKVVVKSAFTIKAYRFVEGGAPPPGGER
jgi:type IV pilus assembly protein PilO